MNKQIVIKKWRSGVGYCYLLQCNICNKEFILSGFQVNTGQGKFCSFKCYWLSKIGKSSWNKGKKTPKKIKEKISGKNNHCWKGEKASYSSKHEWVMRLKGKPTKCQFCNKINPPFIPPNHFVQNLHFCF